MTFKAKKKCDKCNGSGIVKVVDPASLRQQRLLADLGLREFARKVKLSAPYISDVERGLRKCTPKLEKLYEALH